jgi:hypothetical protein
MPAIARRRVVVSLASRVSRPVPLADPSSRLRRLPKTTAIARVVAVAPPSPLARPRTFREHRARDAQSADGNQHARDAIDAASLQVHESLLGLKKLRHRAIASRRARRQSVVRRFRDSRNATRDATRAVEP